jgi:hypothetical protein
MALLKKNFCRMLQLLLVLNIAACSTLPKEFEELHPIENGSSFTIPNRIQAKQKVGLSEWEYGLDSGVYVAVAGNSSGAIYRGPGRSVLLRHSRGVDIRGGGVWVSTDPAVSPKLYVYQYTDVETFDDLAAAIRAQATYRKLLELRGESTRNPKNAADDSNSDMVARYAADGAIGGAIGGATGGAIANGKKGAVTGVVSGAISGAIIGGILAVEMEKGRGIPIPLFTVENEELGKILPQVAP